MYRYVIQLKNVKKILPKITIKNISSLKNVFIYLDLYKIF